MSDRSKRRSNFDSKFFFEKIFQKDVRPQQIVNRYYQKYENKQKQKSLLSFWQSTLEKFFSQVLKGSCIIYQDLEQFFTLDGIAPNGLQSILAELSHKGEYLLLDDVNKITNINQHIGVEYKSQISKFTENIFSSIFQRKSIILPNTVIIKTSIFKIQYDNCIDKQRRIFDGNGAIEEREYLNKCIYLCNLSREDNFYVNYLMMMNKELQVTPKDNVIFCIPKQGTCSQTKQDVSIQMYLLKCQIDKIDQNIKTLGDDIMKVSKLAAYYKKMNIKDTALLQLKNKKVLEGNLGKLMGYKILLENTLSNLKHPHNNKELNDILKQCNKLLQKEGQINDDVIDVINDLQEVNYKQEEANEILKQQNEADNYELEEMYKQLGDDFNETQPQLNDTLNLDHIEMPNQEAIKSKILSKNNSSNKKKMIVDFTPKIDFDNNNSTTNIRNPFQYQSKIYNTKNQKKKSYEDPFIAEMKQALSSNKKKSKKDDSQDEINRQILELKN